MLKDPIARKAYDRKRGVERRKNGYIAPRIKEGVEKVNKLKSETPCADCGNKYLPICMDFDHLNPYDKYQEVSRLVADGREWSIIQAEIDKCELVCANCHRVRTQLRKDNIKWRQNQVI